jgi:hypothetical protein
MEKTKNAVNGTAGTTANEVVREFATLDEVQSAGYYVSEPRIVNVRVIKVEDTGQYTNVLLIDALSGKPIYASLSEKQLNYLTASLNAYSGIYQLSVSDNDNRSVYKVHKDGKCVGYKTFVRPCITVIAISAIDDKVVNSFVQSEMKKQSLKDDIAMSFFNRPFDKLNKDEKVEVFNVLK